MLNVKIKLAFILLLVLTVLFILKNKQVNGNKYKGYSILNYKLLTTNYQLLVADTPEKWTKGLMYFRSLEGVDGMIFIFPDKQPRTFWNKNTLMNLDLYWLDENQVIGKSYLPSIEKSKEVVVVNSPNPVDKVVEIAR